MKFIDQPNSDTCFSACLASLLDISIDTIPKFFLDGPTVWYENFEKWAVANGYSTFAVKKTDACRIANMVGILSGPSHYSEEFEHAVIGEIKIGGEYSIIHDPSPQKLGLAGEPTWFVFVAALGRGEIR